MPYDAFVSYARDDVAVARTLQEALTRIAKPWYRRRLLRVFRDQTDLVAHPDLWDAIAGAIDVSDWLVVVGSPSAARSRWVDAEVQRFLESHGQERVVVVLVDGEAGWDRERGRWADDTDAVPAALGVLSSPPRVIDARRMAGDTGPRPGVAAVAVATELAAVLLGTSAAEAAARDQRQRRRTRRHLTAVVIAVAVLAGAAVVSAFVEAEEQRAAERRETVARSQQLGAKAQEVSAGNPDLAILLAAEAWRLSSTADAERAVFSAAGWAGREVDVRESDGIRVTDLLAEPSEGLVLAGRVDGSILAWWPDRTDERVVDGPDPGAALVALGALGDGRFAAVAASGAVGIYDVEDLTLVDRLRFEDGVRFAGVATDALVAILDDESLVTLPIDGGPGASVARTGRASSALAVSPDRRLVVTASSRHDRAQIEMWHLPDLEPAFRVDNGDGNREQTVTEVSFSGDGTLVGTVDILADFRAFSSRDGQLVGAGDARFGVPPGTGIAPVGDSGFLVATAGREVINFAADGAIRAGYPHHHEGVVGDVTVGGQAFITTSDGSVRRFVPGTTDVTSFAAELNGRLPQDARLGPSGVPGRVPFLSQGRVELLDTDTGESQTPEPAVGDDVQAAAVHADGSLVTVSSQGQVVITDAGGGTVRGRVTAPEARSGIGVSWAGDEAIVVTTEPRSLSRIGRDGAVTALDLPTSLTADADLASFATSLDGDVATAFDTGEIVAWSRDGTPVSTTVPLSEVPSALAFVPGRGLVAGDALGVIRRYDRSLASIGAPVSSTHGPVRLVVSTGHDGSVLLVTTNWIGVFDAAGREMVGQQLAGEYASVALVGSDVVTIADGVGASWRFDRRTALRTACAAAPRTVDAEEWTALTGTTFDDPCRPYRDDS